MRQQRLWRSSRYSAIGVVILAALFVSCGVRGNSSPGSTATPKPVAKAAINEITRSVTAVQNSVDTEELSATATCPAGTKLVGGGYHLQPTSNSQLIFVRASYPSAADAWTVIESNPQSGGQVTLTAAAICLTASFPVTTTIATGTAADGEGTANCPANTTLTGGGFKQDAPGANVIDRSAPSGSGWHASNISEVPTSFTVYAMCAGPTLARAEIPTATTTIPSNMEGNVAAGCKTGQLLIGGGYTFAKGMGYFLGKDVSVSEARTAWTVRAFNLYTWTGTGPTPTPPSMQVTAYAICVVPAPA